MSTTWGNAGAAAGTPSRADTVWDRRFWICLAGITLLTAGYIRYLSPGLFPDEAYFWDLSRRLQLSYVEKPPLVNYLIRATTGLVGSTEFGVRAGALLTFALFSWITYRFGRQILPSARDAFLLTLLIAVAPMPSAARAIITPDSLLMVTWAAAVWGLYQAILGDGRGRWWLLAAAGLAVGLMAKYTIAFIIPCLAGFLLSSHERRRWLRRPAPYLAVSAGLLGLLPSIIWNAGNHWITWRHMLWQANVEGGIGINPVTFLKFAGSQFAVLSPLLFLGLVAGMIWAGRHSLSPGRDREAFLFWFSGPILAIFVLKSLQGNTLANWAAVSYFTGAYAMALWFRERVTRASGQSRRRLVGWARATYLTAALFTLLAHDVSALALAGLPKAVEWDPARRAVGWRELGQEAGRAARELSRDGPTFLFASRYEVTSELAFYVPGQPRVYSVNWGRRETQYDYWDDVRPLPRHHAVFADQGDIPTPPRLRALFASCEKLPPVIVMRHGVPARTYSLFSCRAFRGLTRETPSP